MPGYRLRDQLSYCRSGDDIVFLDLALDRYFSLAPGLAPALRRLEDRSPGLSADQADVARLIELGIIEPAGAGIWPAPCTTPQIATTALIDLDVRGPALRHLPRATLRLIVEAFHLRSAPLIDATRRVERRQRDADLRTHDVIQVAGMAQAYRYLALLAAAHDRCLWQSLAITHHLLDLGQAPTLVFGVRARPFKAHCWVQLGALLVNDCLDQTATFTPIRTL